MRKRRAVLGDDVVDEQIKGDSSISRRWQTYVTEAAWADCWADETIGLRDRMILTLGMVAALGREAEFEGHVRNAVRNGISAREMEALMVHIGVYCGVPIGSTCARAIQRVVAQASGSILELTGLTS
jgi:4-carboxymuconolactone decarboxylase